MEIFLGLTSALFWGTMYFISRFPTRSIGAIQTGLYASIISFTILGTYLLVSGELFNRIEAIAVSVWGWLLVAATLNTFSSLADFYAVGVGKLTIVTPIIANYGVVTVLISLAAGESLKPLQFVGIGLATVGIAMVAGISRRKRIRIDGEPGEREGMLWAMASAIGYGAAYWIIGTEVTPSLGGIVPAWIFRLNALLILIGLLIFRQNKKPLQLPPVKIWMYILAISVLNSGAIIASFVGYTIGNVGVVTTLASMYVAVTVLLAWWYLKERLLPAQWLGIIAILFAVVLVAQ